MQVEYTFSGELTKYEIKMAGDKKKAKIVVETILHGCNPFEPLGLRTIDIENALKLFSESDLRHDGKNEHRQLFIEQFYLRISEEFNEINSAIGKDFGRPFIKKIKVKQIHDKETKKDLTVLGFHFELDNDTELNTWFFMNLHEIVHCSLVPVQGKPDLKVETE